MARTFNIVVGPSVGGGSEKPSAANTGFRTSLSTHSGDYTANSNGATVSDLDITGQLFINANNVTVRDCNVQHVSGIIITGSDALVEYVDAKHIATVSAVNTTLQYCHIHAFEEDAFHITAGGPTEQTINLTIEHCYVDDPQPPPGAHMDGIQVRGCDGFLFNHNVIDKGPLQSPLFNACVFLEGGNGGNENMTVSNNWLYGSAFTLYLSTDAGGANAILNNKFGGDVEFDYVRGAEDGVTSAHFQTVSGNIEESTGNPIDFGF